MIRFLKNISLFVLVLMLLNIALYFVGDELYLGNYKKYSFDFHSYLFADSHGEPLADLTEKYGVYNFSAGSDSYFDMKRKINFILEETEIDTIYITVDDHTLSSYRELINNLDCSLVYTTVNDYDNVYSYIIDKFRSKIALLQPQIGAVLKRYVFSKLKKLFKPDNTTEKETSLTWKDYDSKERELKSRERFEYQFSGYDKSEKLQLALLDIVHICRENNIVLIGIKFPLSKEYLEIMKDESFHASDVFEKEGIRILDFRNSFIDRDDYFADHDHLSEKGAEKFTELIFHSR